MAKSQINASRKWTKHHPNFMAERRLELIPISFKKQVAFRNDIRKRYGVEL